MVAPPFVMLDATPLFRLYARRRRRALEALDPVAAQESALLRLLARASDTRFGRDHHFAAISSVADFQARVPLRRYEDFWEAYWRRPFPRLVDVTWPGLIPHFAVTSGTTTGVTKFIPCSHEVLRANRQAGADVLAYHVAHRPASQVLAGKSFMLGGSTDLTQRAPGVFSGDLSGIAARTTPWWARSRTFPPPRLALIEDWERKVETLAALSLRQDIRSLSGTPSWLLVFFDKLAALRPQGGPRMIDFYPRLELLVHGGVPFAPYRRRFETLLEGSRADLREVYAASEGFIAIADRGADDGLRLALDNGLFFEFVPVGELDNPNPVRHWLATVEPEVNYALVLSSCAGLWAYVVGDTVRFVARHPPRIVVTGRTSYTLSVFGEHLIAEEVEAAVADAAAETGTTVADYAVGATFPQHVGELGGHLYVVEFADGLPTMGQLAAFARALDVRLCETNEDYAAHRAGGFGLNAPRVQALSRGGFAAWMKSRGQLGGQHKVPRLISDEALFRALREFAGSG